MVTKATLLCATLATLPGYVTADTNGDRPHDLNHFFEAADVRAGPEIVDCTLSEGIETTCLRIAVAATPLTYTPGPWCPTHISDDAEGGSIWFLDGETVDVDGDFVTQLSEICGDTNWQLYDPDTGDIRYTGTLEEWRPPRGPMWTPLTRITACSACRKRYRKRLSSPM